MHQHTSKESHEIFSMPNEPSAIKIKVEISSLASLFHSFEWCTFHGFHRTDHAEDVRERLPRALYSLPFRLTAIIIIVRDRWNGVLYYFIFFGAYRMRMRANEKKNIVRASVHDPVVYVRPWK